MRDINRIFRAGFVQRWHTNPDLAASQDRLDGHMGRVARLMLALWPDTSAGALAYALTHDDGESVVGDVPAPAKTKEHAIEESKVRTDIWPFAFGPSETEAKRIHFCDKLDAFMWAAHHARHVLGDREWVEAHAWLCSMARELHVDDRLDLVL